MPRQSYLRNGTGIFLLPPCANKKHQRQGGHIVCHRRILDFCHSKRIQKLNHPSAGRKVSDHLRCQTWHQNIGKAIKQKDHGGQRKADDCQHKTAAGGKNTVAAKILLACPRRETPIATETAARAMLMFSFNSFETCFFNRQPRMAPNTTRPRQEKSLQASYPFLLNAAGTTSSGIGQRYALPPVLLTFSSFAFFTSCGSSISFTAALYSVSAANSIPLIA